MTAIAASGDSSFAIRSDGTLWAGGDNSNGQLGDGTTVNRYEPVQVFGLTGVAAMSVGACWGCSDCFCAKSDGTVWAGRQQRAL